MSELVTAITTGLTVFSATNIDDLVILLLFFAQVNTNFCYRHIVVGQYLGFTALLVASLPGFLGGLVIARYWIGLLGLIPIAIGLSSVLNRAEDSSPEVESEIEQFDDYPMSSFLSPQTYSVAAVTIANGSDNISIYVPLFASSSLGSLLIILSVFFLLVGVWCYAAYRLTSLPTIAHILTRYGNTIVPFVLIGVGTFIVLGSNSLSVIKLVASCLCLMILVKNHKSSPEVTEN